MLDNPIAIYQDLLDTLSRATIEADWETTRGLVRLPFVIRTLAAEFRIDAEPSLQEYLLALHDTLKAMGTTDYIQLARSARFLDGHLIEGFHHTHVIRRGQRLLPPYASRVVLQSAAPRWQVILAHHALRNDHWPLRLPVPAEAADFPPSGLRVQDPPPGTVSGGPS